jgi:hypothetical protein
MRLCSQTRFTAFVAGLAVLLAAATSLAGVTIDLDPLGASALNAPSASSRPTGALDWDVGNSLSLGAGTAILAYVNPANPGVQLPIQTLFQARLGVIKDGSGVDITPVGNNSTFQLTAVGAFQEIVTSFSGTPGTFGSTAFLGAVAGGDNYFEIYATPAIGPGVLSSDLQGTGFNDDTLILRASVVGGITNYSVTSALPAPLDQFNTNDYAAGLTAGVADASANQLTVTGQGNTTMQALVNYTNPAYFPTPPPPGFLIELDFTTTVNDPYLQTDPSARFLWSGGVGPGWTSAAGQAPGPLGAGLGAPSGQGLFGMGLGIGATNGAATGPGGQGGPDIQFQADAATSFDLAMVPEPGSMLIWSLMAGAIGLARLRRRRRDS